MQRWSLLLALAKTEKSPSEYRNLQCSFPAKWLATGESELLCSLSAAIYQKQHTKFKSVSDVATAGSKSALASIAHEYVATPPEKKSLSLSREHGYQGLIGRPSQGQRPIENHIQLSFTGNCNKDSFTVQADTNVSIWQMWMGSLNCIASFARIALWYWLMCIGHNGDLVDIMNSRFLTNIVSMPVTIHHLNIMCC